MKYTTIIAVLALCLVMQSAQAAVFNGSRRYLSDPQRYFRESDYADWTAQQIINNLFCNNDGSNFVFHYFDHLDQNECMDLFDDLAIATKCDDWENDSRMPTPAEAGFTN